MLKKSEKPEPVLHNPEIRTGRVFVVDSPLTEEERELRRKYQREFIENMEKTAERAARVFTDIISEPREFRVVAAGPVVDIDWRNFS